MVCFPVAQDPLSDNLLIAERGRGAEGLSGTSEKRQYRANNFVEHSDACTRCTSQALLIS